MSAVSGSLWKVLLIIYALDYKLKEHTYTPHVRENQMFIVTKISKQQQEERFMEPWVLCAKCIMCQSSWGSPARRLPLFHPALCPQEGHL
jgi:hypothetical protein